MKTFISSILFTLVGVVSASPVLAQTALTNPLGSTTDPNTVIANIIKVSLGVVGGLALVIFIYGGLLMLLSAGNPERVKHGRDALMWATIGLIIIFGSYGIVNAVFNAIAGQALV